MEENTDLENASLEQLQATKQAFVQERQQRAQEMDWPTKEEMDNFSLDRLQDLKMKFQMRQEEQLAPFREQMAQGEGPHASVEPGIGNYLLKSFVGLPRGIVNDSLYGIAKGRLSRDEAQPSDLYVIAAYEHEHGLDQQQSELAKYAGAGLGAMGSIGLLGLAPGATFAAQALTGASAQAGQPIWNPEVILKGGATAGVQLGVLKAMGPLAGKLFPEAEGVLAQAGSQAVTGTVGLAVADYGTAIAGLSEHGGPIQDIIDGKYGDAARGALGNFIMTLGLGAVEGLRGGLSRKASVDRAVKGVEEAARQATQNAPGTPETPPEAPSPNEAVTTPPAQSNANLEGVQASRTGLIDLRQELEAHGQDINALSADITKRAADHLAAGGKVSAWVDGKEIPITSVEGGMLRDAKGQPWGMMPLLSPQAGTKGGVELKPPERRTDVQRRGMWDNIQAEHPEWSTEQVGREAARRADELLVDPRTGLGSVAKLAQDANLYKDKPFSIYDVPSMHEVNNHFGDQAGDALLAAHGAAMREAGIENGYRKGGDELAAFFSDPKEQAEKGAKYADILKNTVVEWVDANGHKISVKGFEPARSEGANYEQAQAGIPGAKQRASEAGIRSRAPGELPPSLTVETTAGGAAEGRPAERAGGIEDQAPQRQGVQGKGGAVDLSKRPGEDNVAYVKRLLSESPDPINQADLRAAGINQQAATAILETLVRQGEAKKDGSFYTSAGGVGPERTETPPEAASLAKLTPEEFNSKVWYQGVAQRPDKLEGEFRKSQWVTTSAKKARDYAKRHGKEGHIDVYTGEQLGEGKFVDDNGNPISEAEYRKRHFDNTIDNPASVQPVASIPIEAADNPHAYLRQQHGLETPREKADRLEAEVKAERQKLTGAGLRPGVILKRMAPREKELDAARQEAVAAEAKSTDLLSEELKKPVDQRFLESGGMGGGGEPVAPGSIRGKTPDERMSPAELHAKLVSGDPIPGLTKRQQEAFTAIEVERLDGGEAARKLGISRQRVAQLHEEAAQRLHKLVEEAPAPTVGAKSEAKQTELPEETPTNKFRQPKDAFERHQDRLDDLASELLKKAEKGELTPEDMASYAQEAGRPMAMGAAALGELTPPEAGETPKGPTALANAKIDQERVAEGMNPIIESARMQNREAWDAAMAKLEADPRLGERLATELSEKPRPADVIEQAILLREKIGLDNEYRVLAKQLAGVMDRGGTLDSIEAQALDGRLAELERRRTDLALAVKRTGTELGRSLQFRRQLAAEDYSLQGLLAQLQAAKGAKKITPEEFKQIQELQAKIVDLQAKLDAAEEKFAGATKPAGPAVLGMKEYKEMEKARVAATAAKGEADKVIETAKKSNQTWDKALSDWLIKARVNWVISGPTTLAKIAAASGERLGQMPLEEAAGRFWAMIPGISKIAAKAPRQGRGLSLVAEKRALVESFTQGIKDAWRTIRTGQSELDVQYGPKSEKRSWLDYQFSLHDALKAPAVRGEYTRSLIHRIDAETRAGRDATSPTALFKIGLEAYKDAQSAKFRQDNWLVDATNRAINSMRSSESVAGRVAGTTAKLLMPVVRIPTNLAFEIATHIFGTPLGAAGALHARFVKGIENLKPEQADRIMQQFKKGSIGLALLGIGYANPQLFGGFYSGKRKEDDVKAGAIKIGGVSIPSWLLHNPALEVLQVGATARRAADKLDKGKPQGLAVGIGAAAAGLGEEIPLAREGTELGHLLDTNARERGWHFGELAKSFAVPQLVQWLAGNLDKSTPFDPSQTPTKRKPETTWQHIEMGIPGLRKRVPEPARR